MISEQLTELRKSTQQVSNHCRGLQLDEAYEELDRMEGIVGKLKSEINGVGRAISKATPEQASQ